MVCHVTLPAYIDHVTSICILVYINHVTIYLSLLIM